MTRRDTRHKQPFSSHSDIGRKPRHSIPSLSYIVTLWVLLDANFLNEKRTPSSLRDRIIERERRIETEDAVNKRADLSRCKK